MKKLGPTCTKWLKIFHIGLVMLFFGGIISSYMINSALSLSSFNEVNTTYKNLIIISDRVVRYGAQGTLLMGLLYGVATNWGFFKHKWVAAKWIVFIVQTFIGILVVDKLMVANMTMLETEGAKALSNPAFLNNHSLRNEVVVGQIVLTMILLCLSVFKPWRKKNAQ